MCGCLFHRLLDNKTTNAWPAGRQGLPEGGGELRRLGLGLPAARPGKKQEGGKADGVDCSWIGCSSPQNVRVCFQAGTQPWTVGVDLFDLAVQERFLVCMNLGYLLITFALYFFMRRREVRWGRLCLGGGNAAERAPCSLPRDLLDLPLTTRPQRRHPHRHQKQRRHRQR